MKIVLTDNYDRELYDEKLIAENVAERVGNKIVDLLNDDPKRFDEDYYKLVEDDYKLFERDY
ncbi:hypothetical protein ACUH7Y_06890 [Clostridium beijerinckii]|jgi:hypothetical protein|uniref:Uncharacterized protein n=1 Tax=Clostridium beijerinckii TaxID=1520 RepID=A0A7X9SQR6_CLOBE|nr:hypothetical protein [Clostridium beijerinckii]NMF06295.1 hypothetical protein [Clostridium beijerinckii]